MPDSEGWNRVRVAAPASRWTSFQVAAYGIEGRRVHQAATTLELDRRLRVVQAPSFGLVGKPQTVTIRVEDETAPAGTRAPAGRRATGRGSVDMSSSRRPALCCCVQCW